MKHSESVAALSVSRSVLAVCAHPDDESFGLGAVLHRFVANGSEASVLYFTRGEASTLGGSNLPLTEIRTTELAEAARRLGVRTVKLLGHPDNALGGEPLDDLASEVEEMVAEAGVDLLLVFDEGGVTAHPDHQRATEAALTAATGLPVLAWTLPRRIAERLNIEFGVSFVGRDDDEIDLVVEVERERQRNAIASHVSQSGDNPVLWRRLELLGDHESLRWLRPPPVRPTS